MLHPEIAARSCEDCQKWLYNDKPGRFADKPMERGGRKVERLPLVQLPPCRWCPKIPDGDAPKPENAQELSPRNLRALVHYRECRAVLRFPDDPLVRRHAAVIRQVEDDAAAEQTRAGQIEAAVSMIGQLLSKRAER